MLYAYYRNLKNQEKNIRYILIFFRLSTIFLLLVIFLQPILSTSKIIDKNKQIVIFLDNSKSMSYSIKNNHFKNQLNQVIEKLENSNIDFEFYLFGDSVRKINKLSEINFSDKSTDLNQISRFINYLDSDQYILITDGMQNQSIIDFNIGNSNAAINTFGVGYLQTEKEDLSIDNITVNKINKDSISIKCKIYSNTSYNHENIAIKLSNDKVSNKILTYVNISKKNNIFFYDFNIIKNYLSNNNIIYIDNIQNEIDVNNNYYHLQLDSDYLHKKNILLFSGRLSQNTKYIKNLLQRYSTLDFIHFHNFFNFDLQNFDYSNYDVIIFDSFPINDKNLLLINQNNIFKNKNIAFFQGPSNSYDYAVYNKFLLDWGYTFVPENKNNLKASNLYSNTLLESQQNIISKIVPINIDRRIINNKQESTIFDDRGNSIIDYNNNNLFVFIPNLTKLSNETLNIYKKDNLEFLINSYLRKVIFGSDKDIITIYTDKDTYYSNENFYLYVDTNSMNPHDIAIYLYNKDGSIRSKITECNLFSTDLHRCNIKIDYPNNYFIQAKIKSQDNFNISSNRIDIIVNDLDIEIKNIGLNKEILENIALNYGGSYFDFEKINDYIYSIKSDTYSEFELKEISIFNFQSFWFIILLFLIIEWIVRKNKGLL